MQGSSSESTPRQEATSEPRDPNVTSSVFNLDSYDADTSVSLPNEVKDVQCCEIDKALLDFRIPQIYADLDLSQQPSPLITITEAAKTTDMSGSSFIAYHIKSCLDPLTFESKHRYSEFEGLRKLLVRSYPSVVVPPIPEKHSYADYAAKPGKAKEDPKIILLRKRMLQTFLNKVAQHPLLRGFHPFHSFLKGDVSWSEVVSSSGLSDLLKKKDGSIVTVNERTHLKKPDYTARFTSQMLFIKKIQKRLIGGYRELINICSSLGAHYNGWSLTENTLSEAIEQTGQAVDSNLAAMKELVSHLEVYFAEAISEYILFGTAIDKLLRVRHKRHCEFELVSETLIAKQALLTKMESSEYEAQRLAAALRDEGVSATPQQKGLIATINSLIDNDPEATRRNNISKTKDLIIQLEESREQTRQQLLEANALIQRDLDRFQRQKIQDIRKMLVCFGLAHKEYHQSCLKAWSDAKQAIERIS